MDDLLPGGAAGGDGSPQPLNIDPQDACQERQGAQMRAPDALPQPVDGPRVEAVPDGPSGQATSDGRQVGGQQIVEGLGGGSLACHDRTNSRPRQEKQSPGLDTFGQIADAPHVEKTPTGDALADAPAGADQKPCEEPVMEATNTNIVAAEQTNAAFREAVERRAALRAAVESEQIPPSSLCRMCEEPLALLEMREQLCSECESAENERLSRDYELERAADAPYHGRR